MTGRTFHVVPQWDPMSGYVDGLYSTSTDSSDMLAKIDNLGRAKYENGTFYIPIVIRDSKGAICRGVLEIALCSYDEGTAYCTEDGSRYGAGLSGSTWDSWVLMLAGVEIVRADGRLDLYDRDKFLWAEEVTQ